MSSGNKSYFKNLGITTVIRVRRCYVSQSIFHAVHVREFGACYDTVISTANSQCLLSDMIAYMCLAKWTRPSRSSLHYE